MYLHTYVALTPYVFKRRLNCNVNVKYVDVDLLVPEDSSVDLSCEFIMLRTGLPNTKWLLIFRKPKNWFFTAQIQGTLFVYPNSVETIEQVKVAKLLGMFIQSNCCCEEHVRYILTVCSQRLYLLKMLRAKRLQASQLHHICLAIVISRLVYALPAWGAFLSTELINRINGFLRRLYKYGFTSTLLTFEQLHRKADATLFKKIFNSDYCLYHLLPPVKSLPMQLRPGRHYWEFPLCKYTVIHYF